MLVFVTLAPKRLSQTPSKILFHFLNCRLLPGQVKALFDQRTEERLAYLKQFDYEYLCSLETWDYSDGIDAEKGIVSCADGIHPCIDQLHSIKEVIMNASKVYPLQDSWYNPFPFASIWRIENLSSGYALRRLSQWHSVVTEVYFRGAKGARTYSGEISHIPYGLHVLHCPDQVVDDILYILQMDSQLLFINDANAVYERKSCTDCWTKRKNWLIPSSPPTIPHIPPVAPRSNAILLPREK